ncbi:hypothetical protein RN001_013571 [Aquatica leii]|uniref:Adenylosuccinate synthetase n=1 Tax=Aquatica leii TaxID=1421715 RepID=A0AAN7P2N3_9COLE|nr:hypothetical protein RN001_013571 [Aquatica leii]
MNEQSTVTVIIGAQWGDEGKRKLVDLFASQADVVCRCQGGNNASHTILAHNKSYQFHLLPTGIINPNCLSVIGNGVVIHIPSLLEELKVNEEKTFQGRLFISDKAHIVFDFHRQVDGFEDKDNACRSRIIGTTKKGIGPTYSSKVTRNGIRIIDLMGDFARFSDKFRVLVNLQQRMFPTLVVDVEAELNKYKNYAEALRPYVTETVHFLSKCIKENKSIVVEGANAALLDIDFGTYPYVTSSNCSVGGVSTGLGIPPRRIDRVIGVVKAYTTRVGDGPFPTELKNDVCEYFQKKGNEMSPSTNKMRRCGWLDLFALKYSNMVNCYNSIALSKLDVLDDLSEIKLGVGYSLKGTKIDYFPSNASELASVEVEYVTMPGWLTTTKNVNSYSDLPCNAKLYVSKIEEVLNVPIQWIGVGPSKDTLISIY